MSELTKEFVDLVLKYDASKGSHLVWKFRKEKDFPDVAKEDLDLWNQKYAGKEAGYFDRSQNTYGITINNRTYKAARVIFLMFNGYLPHRAGFKDGNGQNLNPVNLEARNKRTKYQGSYAQQRIRQIRAARP